MPLRERHRELRRRRQRWNKMRALRSRLEKERDPKVRARLLTKIKKIRPLAVVPEK